MNEARLTPYDSDGVVRPLGSDDLGAALRLSTAAGWNQVEADWRLLLQIGRGYGLELPGRGVIGTTMAWEFSARHAWINMVLVAEDCRGRGVAHRLMKACLSDLAASGRTAFLDATDAGARVYARLDFSAGAGIIRLHRPEGGVPPAKEPRIGSGWRLAPITARALPAVARYDHMLAGIMRETVLAQFYRRHPAAAWMLQDATGRLRGFVLGRDGRLAWQLGPLAADSPAGARVLLRQALAETAGPVFMDVPSAPGDWLVCLEAMGFVPQRRFVRMGLSGAVWPAQWANYFAIGGPDFA